MVTTPELLSRLIAFRRQLYQSVLGHRKDTLFELMEAVLVSAGPDTLVRLTLAPPFRRRWSSAPDALAEGTLRSGAAGHLFVRSLSPPPPEQREGWVVDASTWPRPSAATSPERTYGHRLAPGIPPQGVVPAWEYQWLAAAPEPSGSWALPLEVSRRGPQAASPTRLALAQVRRALQSRPPGSPRPVVALDSGYDPTTLATSSLGEEGDFLVRLARNRCLFRAPQPRRGRGRPRLHGAPFRLANPTTQGRPDRQATLQDPEYGHVQVSAWLGLHARAAPQAAFAVVRVQVERLPRRARPPAPLWLAWIGGPLPQDLPLLWRWYLRRFVVEHLFRFLKQGLGWTTVRPRAPEAGDRWSWLLAAVCWQLWLARALVADQRLPWEGPLSAQRLSPGRVRRAFAGLLPRLATPAREPQPRGNSPGRRPGQRPGPRRRYPVRYRGPPCAA
jgi:hypothetical protein